MDDLRIQLRHAWYYITNMYSSPAAHWDGLEWLLVCMALFIGLAFIFPGKKGQPHFRRDMISDGLYWFLGPLLYGPVFGVFASFLLSLGAIHFLHEHLHLNTMPLWAQAFLVLLLTDFLQYWAHRAFHKYGSLWKFHAVHHSSKHVDWLSSARFHPVNIILYSTAVNAMVAAAGFSYDAFLVLIPFNAIYSPLVHANLRWNYGPFKYLLASPVFHRWHHTHPDKGGDKNFAPTFPFIDLAFGTFYMPEGEQPTEFGTPNDAISGNIIDQLIYPFRESPAATVIKPDAAEATKA